MHQMPGRSDIANRAANLIAWKDGDKFLSELGLTTSEKALGRWIADIIGEPGSASDESMPPGCKLPPLVFSPAFQFHLALNGSSSSALAGCRHAPRNAREIESHLHDWTGSAFEHASAFKNVSGVSIAAIAAFLTSIRRSHPALFLLLLSEGVEHATRLLLALQWTNAPRQVAHWRGTYFEKAKCSIAAIFRAMRKVRRALCVLRQLNADTAFDLTIVKLCARNAPEVRFNPSMRFAAAFDKFADKRIIMLGESSHGTQEFYAARTAITQRLVERHGFDFVAVEGDLPDAAVYNRFIRGDTAGGSSITPFQHFPTWMWRNTVIPGLLNTLRRINADRTEGEQIGFYGLDIYNMSGSIEAVLAYLDEHDVEAAAVARERYGCLTPWQADPATYGRAAMRVGFSECEEAVVAQCRELLDKAIKKDGVSFSAAMNARLIASAERYYRIMYHGGSESWNLRDSHMADTLEHLLEEAGPKSNAVVWAHNSHIGDARVTDMGAMRGEHNIGQLARERWGADNVALIGFGTQCGTVSATSAWDGEREVKSVNPSRRDSYERLCHDSGVERFLLDLSRDTRLAERLSEPRLERFIGVIYRPENERWSHYSEAVLPGQFDAWCWFDQTSALEPLEDDEPVGGAAETFPFGV